MMMKTSKIKVAKVIFTLFFFMCLWQVEAQKITDIRKIEQTCLNYIEGFYEGDSTKIIRSIKPTLYKFGYWKNKSTGIYDDDGHMTFEQAINYSNTVFREKHFAKPNAPKIVNVLDIGNHIAAAKITAWWGVDYVLLSRYNDDWLIEQVLWEGPLEVEKNGLTISYIGNMGVLVSSNDYAILIDGFHKKYKAEYSYPTESTVKEIINGEYQDFGKVDVALVTHHHQDHFNSDYYMEFLQKNLESVVISSQQVNNQIRDRFSSDALKISDRLKLVPYNDETHLTIRDNLKINAFKCPHINSARHSSVQNIAYLIYMNNYSILHLGDTNWDVAESNLNKMNLSDISIDVVILPYWMLLDKDSIEKISNIIAPKQIIATHFPPDLSNEEYETLRKNHPNITLFTKLNEQLNYR